MCWGPGDDITKARCCPPEAQEFGAEAHPWRAAMETRWRAAGLQREELRAELARFERLLVRMYVQL